MTVRVETLRQAPRPRLDTPPLENGARLNSREFLRRYEAMPELKKAEVVKGIVYVQGFDWFMLEDAEYVPVKADARGLIRSRQFPGLVLEVPALLALNGAKLLATLQRGLASVAHRTFVASLR